MIEFLDDDIVELRRDDGTTWEHYWGDPLERFPALDRPGAIGVRMRGQGGAVWDGVLDDDTRMRATPILRLSMIDVQQGDGMILETPGGKVVMIDGGDNKLFARHAAVRFPGSSDANPQVVDAIIVTHGDADHFEGLTKIHESESDTRPAKRLFIAPKRVFHNGLVKRPDKRPDGSDRPDGEMFGAKAEQGQVSFATALVADPRDVPRGEQNGKFVDWCDALDAWGGRSLAVNGTAMDVRRIDHLSGNAFDFLGTEGISVEIHGPITETVNGQPALRFLRTPPKDAALMVGTVSAEGTGSISASHTINGHSINFRLRYGNVRFLMTGDMNHESMARMRAALPDTALRCEILKAPHHGSDDFEMEYLREAGPVVSLISSGDESLLKEHIHPRATLMAALGQASRTTPAVIFNTELAAFFAYRGTVTKAASGSTAARSFEGFERLNYGIIHIRTDGERVLAFTHSGKRGLNEAYRFTVSTTGAVEFAKRATKRSAPKAA